MRYVKSWHHAPQIKEYFNFGKIRSTDKCVVMWGMMSRFGHELTE